MYDARMGRLVVILALSIGCGRIGFRPVQTSGSDAAVGDGIGVDVPIVNGGTRITNDPGSSRCPSVAVNAGEFGVAWVDDRDGNDEIYFVRLDQTGARIDLADRRLTTTAAPSECPCLVGNGNGWTVIWPEGASGSEDLFLLILAADGTPSNAMVQVTSDTAGSTAPALAFDGTTYGLVWESHGGNGASIQYASLSTAGAVQQTATVANSGADNRGPAIA